MHCALNSTGLVIDVGYKKENVVNNNVMYFNRGNITLLQAVLICDSGRLGGATHTLSSLTK